MAGFEGKMLEVNVTDGAIGTSTIGKDVLRNYVGGSGLAAKLFFDRVSPNVDPLSPDNQLFITTGPLSGNTLPGGARFSVGTKSPLTNMWGEACCGGNFAAGLRGAGWDGIILQGASSKPVYMVIEDDKVEIKDASDLWGKNGHEVTDILKERHGGKKARVLLIGQAGENLVKYAAVCNEKRDFASRCGLGAVMGSKKLKAVVVIGSGKTGLADPERFTNRRKDFQARAKEHIVGQVLAAAGTSGATDYGVYLGDVPGKNWMIEDNIAIASKLGGAVLNTPEYLTGTDACQGCSIGCKRVVHITKGPYAGMAGPGPEYEGIISLGSLLCIDDMATVIKMNELCNQYGMDVISCGCTIAMAMDCYEQGIIDTKDTDGIELTWGNAEAAVKMIDKIAHRDGFGDVLADGSKRAAERIGKGASKYAVTVKGLEVPMHDPRAMHGMALAYATSVRGACHTNDLTFSIEQGIIVWPEVGITGGYQQREGTGKGEMVVLSQNLGMIMNSSIICYMVMSIINGEDLVELMNSASGFDYTLEELMTCGERIWHLKRGLGNLMGITAADDQVPWQCLRPPKEGPAAGSQPDLELMLKEYYPSRGLNPDGRPSKQTLDRLGMSDLAAKLY